MTTLVLTHALQVEVRSQSDIEELQGVLGLALLLDGGGKQQAGMQAMPLPLPLPCQAPFTSMVPDLMRLAHRYTLQLWKLTRMHEADTLQPELAGCADCLLPVTWCKHCFGDHLPWFSC